MSSYFTKGFNTPTNVPLSHLLSASERIPNTIWIYGSIERKIAWKKNFTNLREGLVFVLKNPRKNIDVKKYFNLASGYKAETGEVAKFMKIPQADIIGAEFLIGSKKIFLSMNSYFKYIPANQRVLLDNLLKVPAKDRLKALLKLYIEVRKKHPTNSSLNWIKTLLDKAR